MYVYIVIINIYSYFFTYISPEQGRRRGLFSSLRGSTTCTGLDNDVYSSMHDREWGYMRWEGGRNGEK